MPEQRPMPLTPEERIERDLLLGEVVDNFPSRRLRVLVSGWAVLLGAGTLFNFALLIEHVEERSVQFIVGV